MAQVAALFDRLLREHIVDVHKICDFIPSYRGVVDVCFGSNALQVLDFTDLVVHVLAILRILHHECVCVCCLHSVCRPYHRLLAKIESDPEAKRPPSLGNNGG